MPKISIILAIYNVEKYLKQCLESLINQTFKDIEILCVEDCSTDNSLKILEEYAQKDNRIKIIKNGKNQGPGVARNNGIDAARGKYIMIVDPDDWLELNACELAYNQIEKYNNDFVMFDYKRYIEKTGKYRTDGNNFLPYKVVIDNPHIDVHKLETNFFQAGFTWGKLFSKKFLQDNNIKYPPQHLCEDVTFMFLALLSSHNISILNKQLYIYRIRKNSASSNASHWKDVLDARNYVIDFIIESNCDKKILTFFAEHIYNSFLYWYNKFSKTDKSIKKLFKKEMLEFFDRLYDYTNKWCKFRYFACKYNLEGLYYNLLRPIGKYCVVLPYRRIKEFLRRRNG